MDPPDPPPPHPPPLLPPPPPPTKRLTASYADALRGQKVFFAAKSQPSQNAQKEFPQLSKQPQGFTSKPAKQLQIRAAEAEARSSKSIKAGLPQVEKASSVSKLPPMPLQSPPRPKFQEDTNVKKVPAARSSYAQALSGKKPPVLPPRSQNKLHDHSAPMDVGQNIRASTSGADHGKPSRPPRTPRKPADGASKQPQPGVPASPATERINGKHKSRSKNHQKRKLSCEWKRHSSSGVWDTPRNDTSIAVSTKDRERRFSMGDSHPAAASFGPYLAEVEQVSVLPQVADDEEEEERLRKVQERARRMAEVIAMHDRGEINLWECQYEWDVLIVCQGHEWRVHHDILCRESDWFKEQLPTKNCNLGYVCLDLQNHSPEQLGSALHFMYAHNYPNSIYSREYPLLGEPIRVNVFKYICGASVNCSNMMRFAFDRLDDAASILSEYLPQLRHQVSMNLITLFDPLGFALAMMYEQGSRQLMFPLRQVMARLVDLTMLDLILNPSFKRAFECGWVEFIYPNLVKDNIWFAAVGLLDPPVGALASQRSQDHTVQQHMEDRPLAWSRTKNRDLDGPWRSGGDVRLDQPWRHDPTPSLCPSRPVERAHTIYLPRPTERSHPPGPETRRQPTHPSKTGDQAPATHPPRPEPIKSAPLEPAPLRPDVVQQAPKIDGPIAGSPISNDWGVWPSSVWEKIEHDKKQHSVSGSFNSAHQVRAHHISARNPTTNSRATHSNASDASTTGKRGVSQEVKHENKKDNWSAHKSGEGQFTEIDCQGGKEVDEEGLIDLDAAEDVREHNGWAAVDLAAGHDQDHVEDSEENKRPQSVSGDWANPWDSAETWRPQQSISSKNLSTRPGEEEEDERSTITTFTPVTSTAGDDVMCESIVFEEGSEGTDNVVASDDDFGPLRNPVIPDSTTTKQPGGESGGGNHVFTFAVVTPNSGVAPSNTATN